MTDEQKLQEELAKERAYWISIRGRALELAIQEFAVSQKPIDELSIFERAETIINYLERGIPIKPGT
jgi:hypothetical protein